VAYTRDGVTPEERPLTFSFNGGPGSSSIWMHMGLLGPRRVALDENGFATAPPHRLVDNPWSLLDTSDLVFIDPVSTGFSRPLDPEQEKDFHGLEADVEAVGEFIRRYVTEFARWASPKFLIGESYGTTRAAALSRHLQHRHGMYLNGIMLVSSVLDFATLRFSEDNDLPYVLFLPSMAATAHYHRQLEGALQDLPVEELLEEVEAFASGPYRQALFAGDSLPAEQFDRVAAQLAAYTGIPLDEIASRRLRLDAFTFFDTLLAGENRRVGRFDGRYTGVAALPWEQSGRGNVDPSYSQVYGAYSSGFNDYVRRELEYESDLPYEVIASVRPWDFGEEFRARYVNVGRRLREAMVFNPHLKVHVCSGYYDLATPYLATEYTLDRLFLDPGLRENISLSYYHAGHMMYTVPAELARQKEALKRFIEASSPDRGIGNP
jgi:carboxypeptidase C (cathepsin A)